MFDYTEKEYPRDFRDIDAEKAFAVLTNNLDDLKETLKQAFSTFVDEKFHEISDLKDFLVDLLMSIRRSSSCKLREPVRNKFDTEEVKKIIEKIILGKECNPYSYEFEEDPKVSHGLETFRSMACYCVMDVVTENKN